MASNSIFFVSAWRREKADDLNGAIEDYTKAIEIDPKDATAYVFRAMVKFKLGDFKGAIEDCTMAIEIDPSLMLAFWTRALARCKLGDVRCFEDYEIAMSSSTLKCS